MTRIEDYALIGDTETAALVGRDGSVDWLCLPRFDSPACFAALLDDERAGHWRIAPVGAGHATRRRYRGDTLVLEQEWDTPDGTVRVVDLMPPRDGLPDVVRLVEGVSGRVRVRSALRLRHDYGSVVPWVRRTPTGVRAVAGPDAVHLDTPVPLHGEDLATIGEVEVGPGDRVPFVLTHAPSWHPHPRHVDAFRALDETVRFWEGWLEDFTFTVDPTSPAGRVPGRSERWTAAVRRSLVLLKALTYGPTGGIVAAATTSLPEWIGGVRNWDYRYCWLRDATFTLQALLGTGFVEEAAAWREWLLRAVAGDPARLQIMYGLDGTRRLQEYELPWLRGYEGSSPVRVGNAAADQFQLDTWGEVLDGLHLGRSAGLETDDTAWDLQKALLDHLEGHWRDPDNSLWEVRGERRHFVHSKVLAWTGLDRAVQAVEQFGLDGPVDRWRRTRDEIHAEVCARGFDADRGTFTQSYGSRGLDSATLLIPQVGFLPWDDERVVGTVDAVQRELLRDGFLLRYDTGAEGVDGLPGDEGAFLACTFWLADALHGISRTDEAVDAFERLLGLCNDVGMLSEEWDPRAGRQLGNTPQAFSHVGLVNTARHLSGSHPADLDPHLTAAHRARRRGLPGGGSAERGPV
ncbi:glycoside hydrolase family 15 protein [Cellulomonas marina]|uniref:Trehalase n=1 Tax=Cellulomonas marina TaxID=988821 RepID=A0A1I1AX10_9CELL|nr:glycoside hydrolase family 15 protein [Cellulomonas marina]GIG30264.1 glucoamylase [Cellulomonas marina]SFB40968.1 Glucoamylase (glucan-1,4-alpha-glucosidase), GH15 family [Cellulomonas marina]